MSDLVIPEQVASEVGSIIDYAKTAEVETPQEYKEVAEFLKQTKGAAKKVKEHFAPLKKSASETLNTIRASEKAALSPIESAERIVKQKMTKYLDAESLAREEKERVAREAMRKKEEERRLKEAEHLEKMGKAKQADAILDKPIETPPIILQKEVPKVEGQSYRKIWKYTIVDETLVPRKFCSPDKSKINAHVKSYKGQSDILGVAVYSKTSIATIGI